MIRNLNREAFFEMLKEKMTELGELFIEFDIINFEHYSPEEDKIQDEEVQRIVEIFKDAYDVVERNI